MVTYWSCAVHPNPSVVAGSRQGYARFLQHSDITGGLAWLRHGFRIEPLKRSPHLPIIVAWIVGFIVSGGAWVGGRVGVVLEIVVRSYAVPTIMARLSVHCMQICILSF